ncbi:Exocyst complex component 4 [Chamberlinius hualienensis]
MDTSDSSIISSPVRPTRQPKESAALLMSVVRSISSSDSNDHRDKEKAKLEKEYKRSDQKLDELIANRSEDMSSVIQTFGKVTSRLTVSIEKIKIIKENLGNCKMLLNCKRDELKRLWLEGIEHKHALFLLEQIEKLKDVPEEFEKYKQKKHYLHATEILVSSAKILEDGLEGVDALNEIRMELQTKRQNILDTLIEDLHRHLYIKSTSDVLKMFRQSPDRGEFSPVFYNLSPSKRRDPSINSIETSLTPTHKFIPAHSSITPVLSSSSAELSVNDKVKEDLLISDPEENSAHFLAIIIQCLADLNKIPDTVETVKTKMRKELVHIVRRTSQVLSESDRENLSDSVLRSPEKSILLQKLLEMIFQQFRCVAHAHECILANLRTLSHSTYNKSEIQLYDIAEFWSCVQAVLQILLSEYLDVENTQATTKRPPSSYVDTNLDVASYFARKRPAKPKKFSLFKFESSSNAIVRNTYLKEQQSIFITENLSNSTEKVGEASEKLLVCKPSSRNILVIYKPLINFIGEMEFVLKMSEGSHCALHTFISEFVREVFVGQVHEEALNTIEAATKGYDAWKPTNMDLQKPLNGARVLLQSTLKVDKRLQELKDIILDLPLHAEPFLDMITNVLKAYKECCLTTYRNIVVPESEDRRIISATWAKDEDVNRFLRSLPNWINLQLQANQIGSAIDIEESPEEIRLRNKKESDMLTNNLADTTIPVHEIISDVNQLKTLALLQESLGWLSSQIVDLTASLSVHSDFSSSPTTGFTVNVPSVSEEWISTLKSLAKDFEDLAEICLLVLHLEVRVHSFYFLLPVAKQVHILRNI